MLAMNGMSYDTISSRSRRSSTRLRALIVNAVLPIVSKKVLWSSSFVSVMDDVGMVVNHLTFLEPMLDGCDSFDYGDITY